VAPLQRDRLRDPQPRPGQQLEQQPVAGVADGQQRRELVACERADVVLVVRFPKCNIRSTLGLAD
jgi:hypothetical protein